MNYEELFLNTLVITDEIESGLLTDEEQIKNTFSFFKEEIRKTEKIMLTDSIIYLKTYLSLSLNSFFDSFFQEEEFVLYKKNLLQNIKGFCFLEKWLLFLKQEISKKEKNKDYQDLSFLYTMIQYIICSVNVKIFKLNDESSVLIGFIKGYNLEFNNENVDDKLYDNEIKTYLLEYKRQKKEEI